MKRFLIILGCLIILLGISGFVLLHFMDSPSSASNISTGASKATSSSQSLSLGSPVQVTGTYASFTYPSIFTAEKTPAASGNIVADYSYEHHAFIPWQLNITIHFLSANEANNDSAYYAMTQDSTRYSESKSTIGENQADIFTDTTAGGFSKVAVLFHNSYSADVSLGSEDGQYLTEQQATLNQVLQSWHWE